MYKGVLVPNNLKKIYYISPSRKREIFPVLIARENKEGMKCIEHSNSVLFLFNISVLSKDSSKSFFLLLKAGSLCRSISCKTMISSLVPRCDVKWWLAKYSIFRKLSINHTHALIWFVILTRFIWVFVDLKCTGWGLCVQENVVHM